MEARLKQKLPQEGTSNAGESLPELSSGCPTDSGGGKILPSHDDMQIEKSKPILTQCLLHTRKFQKVRSLSTSEGSDKQNTTHNKFETNWVQVSNNKRQRSSPEPIAPLKQSKLDTYWLSQPSPITTSNSFAVLEDEQPTGQIKNTNITPTVKQNKPPPIFVDKVSNIQPLIELLEEHAHDNYDLKILQNEQVKIQPKTAETYTVVVKELENKNTEFYTYKPKQDRSFKVILKNMHPSTCIDDIKEALEALEHECTNIWNIKQYKTKNPLPMFIVELKQKDNNKSIYDIKYLLHCKIVFEPPRPKREIPQCGNCLQYGHTKMYCRRSPKCIKCAGNHLSADCPRKTRSDSVKCVLCEGNHPANYKGCKIYRELQKIKFPTAPKKEIKHARSFENTKQAYSKTATTTTNSTYAEKVINRTQAQIDQPNKINNNYYNNDIKELMTIMKQMMQQITTLTNLILNLTSKLTPNWIP